MMLSRAWPEPRPQDRPDAGATVMQMENRSSHAMPSAESVLVRMEFTTANRAHECGYNKEHRLSTGMARLTIRDRDGESHYCLECAKVLLVQGVEQLQSMMAGANRLADI